MSTSQYSKASSPIQHILLFVYTSLCYMGCVKVANVYSVYLIHRVFHLKFDIFVVNVLRTFCLFACLFVFYRCSVQDLVVSRSVVAVHDHLNTTQFNSPTLVCENGSARVWLVHCSVETWGSMNKIIQFLSLNTNGKNWDNIRWPLC